MRFEGDSDPGDEANLLGVSCECGSLAPVAAFAARAMGAALLRQAMTTRVELDLSSYDRFFPSQDYMPKAGFGNLFALPLWDQGFLDRQVAKMPTRASWMWPLLAMTSPASGDGVPVVSVKCPPASVTMTCIGATSHGLSPKSIMASA